MRQEAGATAAGVAGVAVSGVTFLMDTVGGDRPGNRFPVLSFEIGFYLWQGAMLLGLLGSAWLINLAVAEYVIRRPARRRSPQRPVSPATTRLP